MLMNIDTDHRNIALELSYLNVIKISGRDAIGFLNDQFHQRSYRA